MSDGGVKPAKVFANATRLAAKISNDRGIDMEKAYDVAERRLTERCKPSPKVAA